MVSHRDRPSPGPCAMQSPRTGPLGVFSYCSLLKGHEGEHMARATGGEVVAHWPAGKVMTPAVPFLRCTHLAAIVHVSENDDRTRVIAQCVVCRKEHLLTYAKRLDDEGREAWGPIGVWTESEGIDLGPESL